MAQRGYLVSKFDDCVFEAIKNIREDREKAEELINDAKNYIQQNVENHKYIGTTMAKYIEAMQRSNEQLIKISTLLQKGEKEENLDFSPEELEAMHADWKNEEG